MNIVLPLRVPPWAAFFSCYAGEGDPLARAAGADLVEGGQPGPLFGGGGGYGAGSWGGVSAENTAKYKKGYHITKNI